MFFVKRPVVEVFYSDRCPNCKPQKKLIAEMDVRAEKKFTDVDVKKDRASNFGVRSLPTTVVYSDGYGTTLGFTGLMRKSKVEDALKVVRGEKDESVLENDNFVKDIFQQLIKYFRGE